MQRVAVLRHALVLRLGRLHPMSTDDTGGAARWKLVGFYRPMSRERSLTELFANDDSACAARDDRHSSTLLVGSRATLLVGSRPMCSHEVQATHGHDDVQARRSREAPRLAYVWPRSTTQGAPAHRCPGIVLERSVLATGRVRRHTETPFKLHARTLKCVEGDHFTAVWPRRPDDPPQEMRQRSFA